jgi:serine-type D-Ala-D-Ala carboxypeptidase/endopeptidase (penicillin-binding protein 4)
MSQSDRSKKGHRGVRILVIVAANAVCILFLWKLVFARAAHEAGSPNSVAAAGVPGTQVDPALAANAALQPASPQSASAQNASAQNASAAKPARARDTRLEARIRARIAEWTRKADELSKGKVSPNEVAVSVHVRELGTPGDLASIDADRSLRPASNMKLVTSAAALVLLGPDWSFDTLFESSAPLVNGALQGDLVVHAGGDPLYDRDAHGDVTRFFAPVIASLKAQGITRIDGAIVLDEGSFEDPSPAPGWPAENQHWQEFCALAGGFSANAGCLTAFVTSTNSGRAAQVEVRPAGHGLAPKIAVQTGNARTSLDVRVAASNGILRVDGSIPKDVPTWEGRFAAPDPVNLFGGALEAALKQNGVSVAGGVKRERTKPRADSRVLAHLKTKLVDVLGPINTWSNNACADQLFFAMGNAQFGHGTREGGRAATARALEKLGLDASVLVQVDGSGLSREDRVSARQMTGLIDAVMRRDTHSASAFLESLAVGGETGTLDRRLDKLEGRVHAKTGFIGGTSALSGLLDATDGRTLVFSILVEYPNIEGLNKNCWKPMEDAICEELAGASG